MRPLTSMSACWWTLELSSLSSQKYNADSADRRGTKAKGQYPYCVSRTGSCTCRLLFLEDGRHRHRCAKPNRSIHQWTEFRRGSMECTGEITLVTDISWLHIACTVCRCRLHFEAQLVRHSRTTCEVRRESEQSCHSALGVCMYLQGCSSNRNLHYVRYPRM